MNTCKHIFLLMGLFFHCFTSLSMESQYKMAALSLAMVPLPKDAVRIIMRLCCGYGDYQSMGRLGRTCHAYRDCYRDVMICNTPENDECSSFGCSIFKKNYGAGTKVLSFYAIRYKEHNDQADKIMFQHLFRHHAHRNGEIYSYLTERKIATGLTLNDQLSFYSGEPLRCEEILMMRPRLLLAIKNKQTSIVQEILSRYHQFEGWSEGVLQPLCELGDFVIIKNFLSIEGRGIDYRERGNTALIYACQYGNFGLVQFLLNSGANQAVDNGVTPLHYACEKGHAEIVKILLNNGADPNIIDVHGETPLHYACEKGHIEIVKILLNNGADPNIANKYKNILLHKAVENRFVEIVKILLDYSVDSDEKKEALLYRACGKNLPEIVKILLDKGINPNVANKYGAIPLHYVCNLKESNIEIIRILLHYGANINLVDKNGKTPLYHACSEEGGKGANLEVVKILLENKADPNIVYDRKETLLHKCCYNVELIKLLADGGANVKAVDEDGRTPLHCVKRKEIVEILVNKGADVNVIDSKGRTPLHSLCHSNGCHTEAIKFLLENGADPNIIDNEGSTPLCYACEHNAPEIMRILLENKANPNVTYKKYEKPLPFYATENHRTGIVKLLVAYGANDYASLKKIGIMTVSIAIVCFFAAKFYEKLSLKFA